MKIILLLTVALIVLSILSTAQTNVPAPDVLKPLPECSLRCQIISFFLEKPFLVISVSSAAQQLMDEQGIELKEGGIFVQKELQGIYYLPADLLPPGDAQTSWVNVYLQNEMVTLAVWDEDGTKEVYRWNGQDFEDVPPCGWWCRMTTFADRLFTGSQTASLT